MTEKQLYKEYREGRARMQKSIKEFMGEKDMDKAQVILKDIKQTSHYLVVLKEEMDAQKKKRNKKKFKLFRR